MIILDTHVMVWLDQGSDRLGKKALLEIDRAYAKGSLYVCSISFWEVSMLVVKQRLVIQQDVSQWRRQLMENGLKEIVLTGEQAINAGQLNDFHGDPADRLITSSSLAHAATLCTADKKILDWKPNLKRLDAQR